MDYLTQQITRHEHAWVNCYSCQVQYCLECPAVGYGHPTGFMGVGFPNWGKCVDCESLISPADPSGHRRLLYVGAQ